MNVAAHRGSGIRWALFALLVVAGLFYVKWYPYYGRAFDAAENHSIGHSILMGDAAAAPAPSWGAAVDYALAYGKAIWKAMVLGLLLGSAVQALLPANAIRRLLGTTAFGSTLAGGLLGVPGMMCTCCAAPVVAGLRKQQAAPGASVAFWLSNTMLNPATLIFTGFVLGWHWVGLRIALAIPMVFGLGWLANRMVGASTPVTTNIHVEAEAHTAMEIARRWLEIFVRMTVRLIPEYIVIVLALGAARAWLFPHIGPDIGNQWYWIAGLAVAGMLFVIPTAGEVPIVQAMLTLGIGVGPAAALLMTLPPVSLPSLAMLGRSLPLRVLVALAACVVAFGILAGYLAFAIGLHQG
ncbi:permease [Luteibacter aegosomatissinici]|uniref:permease n=1 Tax=Luteibacter aegosomatissinici TaxID=2911539 RepID=UPI001FFC26F9|nr:permease [Luteibacter aegosomatissinici]UPG92553.1 permease [Luteibacter aegosomatissinici]